MIKKLDRHIKTEENGVRISCPPTHADCIDKINELVDAVNGILDYAPLEMAMKAEPKTRPENVQEDPESGPENVREPITLIDMFNEMGRLYADLWNKLEDIHYELRNKGGDNE